MGWGFIILGILVIGIGSFLTYYGKELLSAKPASPATHQERMLTGPQEKLLGLLFKYQRDFASRKLIIGRNGELSFDDGSKAVKINFLTDLYGSKAGDRSRMRDFASLMESLPTEYVRFHAETRFDNPFVVEVTQEGVRYLREYR